MLPHTHHCYHHQRRHKNHFFIKIIAPPMKSTCFRNVWSERETFGKANIRSPSTISTLGVSSLFDASSSCHRDTFGSSWEKEARARKRRNFWDVSCDPQEMCEIRHRNCSSFCVCGLDCISSKHDWEENALTQHFDHQPIPIAF